MKFFTNLWAKIPDVWKVRIISTFNTFASTFIVTLSAGIIAAGNLEWSVAFWGSLSVAALRSAWKAVFNLFLPIRLGGKGTFALGGKK